MKRSIKCFLFLYVDIVASVVADVYYLWVRARSLWGKKEEYCVKNIYCDDAAVISARQDDHSLFCSALGSTHASIENVAATGGMTSCVLQFLPAMVRYEWCCYKLLLF